MAQEKSTDAAYQPAVALAFFKAAGKAEKVAAGTVLFKENEKARPLLFKRDRMYLLLEGEVELSVRRKPIAAVKKGEIFGEMSSLTHAPRSASAVAKTACRVIAVDDRQFEAGIAKKPAFALMLMSMMIGRLRQTIARLSAAQALTGTQALKEAAFFDPRRLADLAEGLGNDEPVFYEQGKPIVQEGQKGLRMYVVMEGRVLVSIGGNAVERLGPGGVFGELALLDQAPRMASAFAETDCTLLPINRTGFLLLVKTSPDFAVSLLSALSTRLQSLTARLP